MFCSVGVLGGVGSPGLRPLATVILPVLLRTSVFRGSGVSLDEYNQRVRLFNKLVESEVFRRDCV